MAHYTPSLFALLPLFFAVPFGSAGIFFAEAGSAGGGGGSGPKLAFPFPGGIRWAARDALGKLLMMRALRSYSHARATGGWGHWLQPWSHGVRGGVEGALGALLCYDYSSTQRVPAWNSSESGCWAAPASQAPPVADTIDL